MPEKIEIHPLLDREKQRRAKEYNRRKRFWSVITSITELVILVILVMYGAGNRVYNYLAGLPPLFQFLLWATILAVGAELLSLIPGIESEYMLEKKYGFMKQSFTGWLTDLLKSTLIGIVIAWIVLLLLGWVVKLTGPWWWLVFAGALFFLEGILAMIFPVVILPLFHKYEPIGDENLTGKLKEILERAGIRVIGFYREDSSRKTGHDNAFFTGFGKTRRIVLYDNLIDNYTVDEIAAVIAHEAAHRKKNHIIKLLLLNLILTAVISFVVHLVMLKSYHSFFEGGVHILKNIFPFILVFSLMMFIAGILTNAISRIFEREADTYALKYTGSKEAFISMLARLANRNLSDAYPGKWIKVLFMSHPPIGERIAYIEKQI